MLLALLLAVFDFTAPADWMARNAALLKQRTLASVVLPGRAPQGFALLTAICGGARHPELASLPDEALEEAVREDVKRALGAGSEPHYRRIVRYSEGISQYEVGHAERVQSLRELTRELPPLELAGAAYDGVSVPDVARSGAAAALRLLS
ncbi:MAG TPA: FAD-dependent oxidoreductase [Myxococcales bacterium]|nr:FAD-dependent oxidoreductase [Myxococcales bacterium]